MYERMLKEVPDDYSQRDQIDMDVRRSMQWSAELRPHLRDLLLTFSFYNDRWGYVQGMNFLAEHLMKMRLPMNLTYSLF